MPDPRRISQLPLINDMNPNDHVITNQQNNTKRTTLRSIRSALISKFGTLNLASLADVDSVAITKSNEARLLAIGTAKSYTDQQVGSLVASEGWLYATERGFASNVWDAGINYPARTIVTEDDAHYVSIKQTLGENPETSPNAWRAWEAAVDAAHRSTANPHGNTVIGKASDIYGGQLPLPLRHPTLNVSQIYPNANQGYKILWAEGDTLYATALDRGIRKSVDSGRTWAFLTGNPSPPSSLGTAHGCFLKLPSGTLLAVGANLSIYRSTDDGANWSSVHTYRSGTNPLGSQSWCFDPQGNVYYVEYDNAVDRADVRAYWSTDDAATWQVLHQWNSRLTGGAGHIRHGHACQYDPISDRVYFSMGDTELAAGIYRTTAAGDSVEAVVTNEQVGQDRARAIGIAFFPNHLVWPADSTQTPNLFRMHRDEIGELDPVVETGYRMNATGWFTCKASDDNSLWIASASMEPDPGRIDKASHLYAIEDPTLFSTEEWASGRGVYELGSMPQFGTALAALSPLGQAEIHGDRFWLWSRGSHGPGNEIGSSVQLRAEVSYSTAPVLSEYPKVPLHYGWITASGSQVEVPSGGIAVFARTRVPSRINQRLYIHDMGVYRDGGSGTVSLEIWNDTTGARIGEAIFHNNESLRMLYQQESSEYLFSFSVGSSNRIAFRLTATGSANPAIGTAHVVYAIGQTPTYE